MHHLTIFILQYFLKFSGMMCWLPPSLFIGWFSFSQLSIRSPMTVMARGVFKVTSVYVIIYWLARDRVTSCVFHRPNNRIFIMVCSNIKKNNRPTVDKG